MVGPPEVEPCRLRAKKELHFSSYFGGWAGGRGCHQGEGPRKLRHPYPLLVSHRLVVVEVLDIGIIQVVLDVDTCYKGSCELAAEDGGWALGQGETADGAVSGELLHVLMQRAHALGLGVSHQHEQGL